MIHSHLREEKEGQALSSHQEDAKTSKTHDFDAFHYLWLLDFIKIETY